MAVESNDTTAVTENVKSNTLEGSNAVTINIRCSNGTKFSVQATLDSSVESFKSVVEQSCDIPAGQQKIIYKGLILKDDQTLQSYGMEPEHTVYLVRIFVTTTPVAAAADGAPTTTTTSTPPVAAGGRRRGIGVYELDSYRAAIARDSMHARMINDPVRFGQIMETARRPTFVEQMMRNLGVTDADPTTGSPAPNTNPLPNPWTATAPRRANQTNAAAGETGRSVASYIFGADLSGGTTPDASSMSQLMQNPAISQMMQGLLSNPQSLNEILDSNPQMQSMLDSNPQLIEMIQNPDFIRHLTSPENMQQMMTLQQSVLSGLGQQEPTQDLGQTGGATVPPEEFYATQLTQLQEMGFSDTLENLRALAATGGYVQAAVERLLGNLGQ